MTAEVVAVGLAHRTYYVLEAVLVSHGITHFINTQEASMPPAPLPQKGDARGGGVWPCPAQDTHWPQC